MGTSTISWLAGPDGKPGKVWNPTTGCRRISRGCEKCYAERLAHRFWGERPFTDVQCHEDRLDMPLRWKKPQMIFVNSMSDLFHESVPYEFITRVFDTMCSWRWPNAAAKRSGDESLLEDPGHKYLILTKRPERIMPWLHWVDECWPGDSPFNIIRDALDSFGPDIWLGVSVEDQATADERIPLLLATPAVVHFVSCEPLLGPIDLTALNYDNILAACSWQGRLDWVIAGGESGPGFRPDDMQWYRDLRDECVAANVPFFFKQRAGIRPGQGAELDGVVWHQIPGQ